MLRRAFLGGALSGLAGMAAAQPLGVPRLAVVVLDREKLYTNSDFGQRVRRDIDAASAELVSENRKIEAELVEEERQLTTQRDTLDADVFRSMAEDFDAKVEGIRRAQDAKARAISTQSDRAQRIFFEAAGPILRGLAQETGALVILDSRSVIAAADQVDITALALARINAELGTGEALTSPPEPQLDDN